MKIQSKTIALVLSASLLQFGQAGAILPLRNGALITSENLGVIAPQFAGDEGANASEVEVMGSYEDSVVLYDARKGESSGSGTNVITIRSSYGTWTVSYDFGYGNYLMLGGGNLEGKYINVRFDDGRPASLQSAYGSGSCQVNSASRN